MILKEFSTHDLSVQKAYATVELLGMSIACEITQQLNKPLARAHLSMSQWSIMKLLYIKRADTPSCIASTMNVNAAKIYREVDPLVHRMLVEREHDKEDRRVIHLHLTSKGIYKAESIFTVYSELFNNLNNRLTQDERTMWKNIEQFIYTKIIDTQKT